MTQHVYDEVIDMTRSSVFHAGYYDDEDKIVYLVFNNGTTVSRRLHPENTRETIRGVRSWGEQWNYGLKEADVGPVVNNGDEFIHRSQVTPADDGGPVVDQQAWDTFRRVLHDGVSGYYDEQFVEDCEYELRAALAAAIGSLPNAQAEPTEDDSHSPTAGPFADAAQNSEGTFIGVGFFDVPEDVRAKVLTAANGLADFVRTEVGEISNVVEQFDVQKVRDLFRRFM